MIQCLIRDYPSENFYHIEDVNASTTLAELKQHFTEFKAIKYSDLKAWHNSPMVDNSKTLAEYNLAYEDEILIINMATECDDKKV
jgi:hypothetical protein